MCPTGIAHIISPSAAGPTPIWSAYGAISASGATTNMAGIQKSSVSARIRRSAKTSRAPSSESRSRFVPSSFLGRRAGLSLVPKRSSAAEQRKVTTVIAIAPRGGTTARRTPPTANPTRSALCDTTLRIERPRT